MTTALESCLVDFCQAQ